AQRGTGVVWRGAGRGGGGQRGRGIDLVAGSAGTGRRAVLMVPVGVDLGGAARRASALLPRPRRRRQRAAPSPVLERRRLPQQRGAAGAGGGGGLISPA